MMNSQQPLANRFVDEMLRFLSRGDAVQLGQLLKIPQKHSISISTSTSSNNKKAKSPSQLYASVYFDSQAMNYLTAELKRSESTDVYTWAEVIEYYILARNKLMDNSYAQAFELLTKSFKCLIDLIKDARDENWQLPVLFTMSVDLRLLAYTCDIKKQKGELHLKESTSKSTTKSTTGDQSDEYAEKTAECLMICFRNLCTDTRADSQVSKRWGMMHVVNQLFKLYFKINKINLCNPLKRVIENSGLKEQFPPGHQIVYKFYVGRQAMFENDYATASEYFEYAFRHCPASFIKNKKIILVYLLPVNMLRGHMPRKALLEKYELHAFAEIVEAVKQGNILKFNRDMIEYEEFFIENGVYLFLEKLKMTTYRNLFKKLARLISSAQIDIDIFVDILKSLGEEDMDTDECQCILSNLIYECKIKGYISHKHNKLVISKDFKLAFPPLTNIPN